MSRSVRRRAAAALAAAVIVAPMNRLALAATFTWTGSSPTSPNWGTAANWAGNAAPANNGTADLHFAGTVRPAAVAEAAYSVRSLSFDAAAAAFNLSGGALTVGVGGIADNATAVQTVNNAVTATGSQTWAVAPTAGGLNLAGGATVAAGGTVTLSTGTIYVGSTFNLGTGTAATAPVAAVNLTGATVNATLIQLGGDGTEDVVMNKYVPRPFGPGTVIQTAGVLNATTRVAVNGISGVGAYYLRGGTLNTPFLAIEDGTFIQTGGNVNVTELAIASSPGGTYNLSNATLTIGEIAPKDPETDYYTMAIDGGTVRAAVQPPLYDTQELISGTVKVMAGGMRIDTSGRNMASLASLQNGTGTIDGGMTKLGAGALTLNRPDSYNGGTTIVAGTLQLRVNTSLGSVGPIQFAGGGLSFAGDTTDYSARMVASPGCNYLIDAANAAKLASPLAGSAGLTKSGTAWLTLSAAETYTGPTVVSGGVLYFNPSGTLSPASTITIDGPAGTALYVDSDEPGYNSSLVRIRTAADLTVGATATGLFNQGDGTVIAPHVLLGVGAGSTGTYLVGRYAVLQTGAVVGGAGRATLAIDFLGTIRASAASTSFVTSGTSIQLSNGPGIIDTNGFDVTVAGSISGSYLNKAGAGTLTLSGINTYSSNTNVSAGTLVAATAAALPTGTMLNLGANTTLRLAAHGATAAGVPVVTINNLAAGSRLDVADNGLDVRTVPLTTVAAYAAAGYANGTWAGTGTSAGGLVSSVAAADPAHLTAVGVIGNSQGGTALYSAARPFLGGVAPAATDVLVRYTYYGDANLDGVVDGLDYGRIDVGYAAATPLIGWYNGDFNYDGKVDGSDYTLIDNAFDLQRPTGAATATAELEAVPEPTAAVAAVLVAAAAVARPRVGR